MAFQRQTGDPFDHLADINVTPLVDVMLVLLIIFMVTAPMLHQGVSVTLPRTETTNIPATVHDPVILSIVLCASRAVLAAADRRCRSIALLERALRIARKPSRVTKRWRLTAFALAVSRSVG